ncbi:hypothetical protein MG290_09075 [Flavobacterium sp. CBA20B-1]|uniref:hypothetical protein n=1 Tax=unclassified Flavobacterium TaxID=196869 RepID=UPI0022259016|nr:MULTISPECIES: hypothetical protein [unclassified Flavobacterium]WCM41108.1 hypothetical protein MG290_09075 [Flavobacterium sp. CBA20B-1]
MKKYIIFLLFFGIKGFCQTGINTRNPHSSAELEVQSDTKGFLPPRLTSAAISTLSATAAEGLIVFDKDKKLFLGWDGLKWQILGNAVATTSTSFASWEVNGITNYGPSPFSASTINANLSSAALSRGSGLSTTGGGANDTWGGSDFNNLTLADAITNGDFFECTLNFVSGKTVSFNQINAMNIRTTNTGSTNIQWQYSINGSTFVNIGSAYTLTSTAATGNNIPNIDLTLYYDLQNINTTSTPTITFRMLGFGGTANSGRTYINNISGNDIEILGSVQ